MTSLQRAGDPGARPTLEELRQDTREVGRLGLLGWLFCLVALAMLVDLANHYNYNDWLT